MASTRGLKSAAAAKTDSRPAIDPVAIDELGELMEWAESPDVKAKLKRLETVKKEICTAVAAGPYRFDTEVTIEGGAFEIGFTKAAATRTVSDIREAHKMLGDDVFYATASIPLKTIDDYLTLPQRAKVIAEGIGSRRIKTATRRQQKPARKPT